MSFNTTHVNHWHATVVEKYANLNEKWHFFSYSKLCTEHYAFKNNYLIKINLPLNNI